MTPRYSVLIPTLNEGRWIAATLAAARAVFGGRAEYIVSDGGSTDATCEIAQANGAQVVRGVRGRGIQLDDAVRAARGEVCILMHADTLLPAKAASLIDSALTNAIGGAFQLRFEDGRLPWLARGINLRSKVLRTATGDQAMFVRRDVLLAAGGVPKVELFEDVRLWRQLKRAGRLELVRAEVTTSARLWLRLGTARGMLLHARLRILHALGVHPRRLARMYPTSGS